MQEVTTLGATPLRSTVHSAHLWTGLIGVVAFLGTGLYMRASFPDLYAGDEAVRYMYRANHIYLLFASALNLAMGVQLTAIADGWKAASGRAGSMLILVAPVVLLVAFFVEPPIASPKRMITFVGVVSSALGVGLQLPRVWQRREARGG